MKQLSYKEQIDRRNIEKIRELQKSLPAFTADFFRAMEIRKSTNTRKNYAYDLGTFFIFSSRTIRLLAERICIL